MNVYRNIQWANKLTWGWLWPLPCPGQSCLCMRLGPLLSKPEEQGNGLLSLKEVIAGVLLTHGRLNVGWIQMHTTKTREKKTFCTKGMSKFVWINLMDSCWHSDCKSLTTKLNHNLKHHIYVCLDVANRNRHTKCYQFWKTCHINKLWHIFNF